MDFLQVVPFGSPKRRLAEEDGQLSLWKEAKKVGHGKTTGPVSSISVTTKSQDTIFIIAGGTVLHFYSLARKENFAQFTRFKDIVRSVAFRNDGRVFAACDNSGRCQVVETETRSVLRRYKTKNGPLSCVAFTNDKAHVVTGSDDGSLRLWEIISSHHICEVENAHSDSIRTIAVAPLLSHSCVQLIATGGYDGKVRTWSISTNDDQQHCATTMDGKRESLRPVTCLDLVDPVEAIEFMPTALLLVAATKRRVQVWQLGAQPARIGEWQTHLSTVTTLDVAGPSSVVTGSLDQTLKWVDFHYSGESEEAEVSPKAKRKRKHEAPQGSETDDGQDKEPGISAHHVQSYLLLPTGVQALRMNAARTAVCIGMSDGSWVVRQQQLDRRPVSLASKLQALNIPLQNAGSRNVRAGEEPREDFIAHMDDALTETGTTEESPTSAAEDLRSSRMTRLLRKFQHQQALDYSLAKGNSQMTLALLAELIQRGSLAATLRGREGERFTSVMQFCARQTTSTDPAKITIVLETLQTLIDENQAGIGTSTSNEISKTFQAAHIALDRLRTFRETMDGLYGILEMIFAVAQSQDSQNSE